MSVGLADQCLVLWFAQSEAQLLKRCLAASFRDAAESRNACRQCGFATVHQLRITFEVGGPQSAPADSVAAHPSFALEFAAVGFAVGLVVDAAMNGIVTVVAAVVAAVAFAVRLVPAVAASENVAMASVSVAVGMGRVSAAMGPVEAALAQVAAAALVAVAA